MNGPLMRQAGWWGASLGYMGLIFYLSSQALDISVSPFPGWDKMVHFTEYSVLSALFFMALRSSFPNRPPVRLAYAAAIVAALYGLSDEFHQSFVPGREASGLDLLADMAGALSIFAGIACRRGVTGWGQPTPK